jgi:hypothetical protein
VRNTLHPVFMCVSSIESWKLKDQARMGGYKLGSDANGCGCASSISVSPWAIV